MVTLSDLNEASVLWNLRIRYDNQNIYTYIGAILVAVNPLRMFDVYGLDNVNKYNRQVMGTLPPHLFALGATGKFSVFLFFKSSPEMNLKKKYIYHSLIRGILTQSCSAGA